MEKVRGKVIFWQCTFRVVILQFFAHFLILVAKIGTSGLLLRMKSFSVFALVWKWSKKAFEHLTFFCRFAIL